MKVAIIGGGAAGFFAAISCKQHHPNAEVVLYEKTSKLLAKVKVSGGGRCNVTHACFSNAQLVKHYPRGSKLLKKAFDTFSTKDTIDWFQSRGEKLKTEADNRMFPITDNSQTIIDCLVKEVERLGVTVKTNHQVIFIKKKKEGFELMINKQKLQVDKVIVATGGSPKLSGFDWLKELGHIIEPPVPSLFTFNMPTESVKELMGVVVQNAEVKIQGTKLKANGPVLITHWGMSGPSILKLSAFGARELERLNYGFKIQVNWIDKIETELRNDWGLLITPVLLKKIANQNPFELPNRLWEFLLKKTEISADKKWQELGKKQTNQLINTLLNDVYEVKGKTTFKEEFVTCGGISLQNVNYSTMQSKPCAGLYLAGEVLDVDGVTGGFNFQAAWTTGFIAGKLL